MYFPTEKQAGMQVTQNSIQLEHCFATKHQGVTLNHMLTYKKHCLNTKQKVSTRKNIFCNLLWTSWGTQLKSTALAICFPADKYTSLVWYSSAHSKQVDIALTEKCRIIIGCLKLTPNGKTSYLADTAPSDIQGREPLIVKDSKDRYIKHISIFCSHSISPILIIMEKFFQNICVSWTNSKECKDNNVERRNSPSLKMDRTLWKSNPWPHGELGYLELT